MFMRRRPLLRAAVIGGGAYVVGKKSAQRSAEQTQEEQQTQQQEDEQNERIASLEQQQAQRPAGGQGVRGRRPRGSGGGRRPRGSEVGRRPRGSGGGRRPRGSEVCRGRPGACRGAEAVHARPAEPAEPAAQAGRPVRLRVHRRQGEAARQRLRRTGLAMAGRVRRAPGVTGFQAALRPDSVPAGPTSSRLLRRAASGYVGAASGYVGLPRATSGAAKRGARCAVPCGGTLCVIRTSRASRS